VSDPPELPISPKSNASPSGGSGNDETKVPWHKKRLTTAQAFFLVGFIVIVLVSVQIILTPAPPSEEESPPPKLYPYHFNVIKLDSSNSTFDYYLEITMESETFSAQMPVEVEIYAEQRNGSRVDELWIIFPRANDAYPNANNQFDVIAGVVKKLDRNLEMEAKLFEDRIFTGTTTIRYEMEGCYNVAVTSERYLGRVSRTLYDPDACSEIRIASLDVTTAAETNKVNLELAEANTKLSDQNLRLTWVFLLLTMYGMAITIFEVITRKPS
jgi:hypothetical protein